ncbi:MAG: Amino acid transporter [Chlorobi bacterium]|nr:Amino acid transporter [Chlorobiota bacterium]
MNGLRATQPKPMGKWHRWLFKGHLDEPGGPHASESEHHHQQAWYKVMCLTGVDYFSTLGYQPGIAFLAAGALSPIATIVLVLVTLFGALPIYRRVAAASPHGEGSIAMLERLLPKWKGKLLVLCLLGFVATDFIITITLSAADATAHVIENPFVPPSIDHPIILTLLFVTLLAAIFIKGFKEAIGIAVVLVVLYLLLNTVVLCVGIAHVAAAPELLVNWKRGLFESHGNVFAMIGLALLLFPKLALGLSGFETGVAVMPLVKGSAKSQTHLEGRIKNTRKLIANAAIIMSVLLISSSFVTTLLIPAAAFQQGGAASGRALAYLAHQFLGDGFGTVYDISTISILWFAGASAMAGLLNIVPRYLPRYGMAPNWAAATRPLVLVFTAIAFAVTIIFKADVESQGGAYATGVLVLMSSAAVAVTLAAWKKGLTSRWGMLLIALVFGYTTVANIIERPEGIKIAAFFIGAIILTSLISRVQRSTELRVHDVVLDPLAQEIIDELGDCDIHIVANRHDAGDVAEYEQKEREQRADNHIPKNDPIVFFEVLPGDASEFGGELNVVGKRVGTYSILSARSPAVPNAIAALLLHLRDATGKIPHAYFGWTEGNPFKYLINFVILGEGDTAPVTHEVLRLAEPDPDRRPAVHVGG